MEDPARRRIILEKMETKLKRLLKTQTNQENLCKAAEKVREAKISFYKGQREIAIYQIKQSNLELKKKY